jgi:hypothetical protein
LFGTTLGIHLTCLAKSFASSLQGCFVDLPVALDEVYQSSTTVGKGSDLLGAFFLSHHNGTIREGIYKDYHLVGSHPKAIGKCFVVECLASLLREA